MSIMHINGTSTIREHPVTPGSICVHRESGAGDLDSSELCFSHYRFMNARYFLEGMNSWINI